MNTFANAAKKVLESSSQRSPVASKASAVLLAALFSVISCVLWSTNVYAQTVSLNDAVARPIPGAGHDYIKGLSETVNPSNGSLAISIALPAPAGRGISFPLSITYNSGEVHRFTSAAPGYGALDWTGTTAYMVADRAQQGNGWSDTLPYVSFEASTIPQPGGSYYESLGWCPITDSYVFYDQAGGSHQLGIAAIGVAAHSSSPNTATPQGCTTLPLGTNYYYGYVQNGGDDEVSASMEFACNGNYYGVVYPEDCLYAQPSFTVTDLHGTVYSFGVNSAGQGPTGGCCGQTYPAEPEVTFPTRIEDRNGNIEGSSISAVGSTGSVVTFTDTAGRTVTAQSNQGVMASYSIGGLTFNLTSSSTGASFSAPYKQLQILQDANATCQAVFTVSDAPYNVVSSIKLPNGQYYSFLYDGTYGLVKEIDYPNGGWVKYQWGLPSSYNSLADFDAHDGNSAVSGGCAYEYSTPVILQRTVGYSKGSAAAQTQTFTYSTLWDSTYLGQWDSKATTVITTDNVTGKSAKTVYNYTYIEQPTQVNAEGHLANQLPVESSVQTFDWGSSSSPVETVSKVWSDQFQMDSQETTWNSGQSSWRVYCYVGGPRGTDLEQEKDEYDFGAAPTLTSATASYTGAYPACGQSAATRRTTYSYLFAIPCQVVTYDSSGNRASEVDAYLDGGSAPCASGAGVTQPVSGLPSPPGTVHDETKYGPTIHATRGNPTEVVRWLNTGGTVISTASYDETGQLISSVDSCGNTPCGDLVGSSHQTTYLYTDSPAGGNSAGNSNAYVTQITDPLGHTQKFTYNYPTGELASSMDENSQVTTYTYADALNRLTATSFPDGGMTSIVYNDSVPSIQTSKLLSASGSPSAEINLSILDGMGHVVETELSSDPSGADIVTMTYDGESHLATKSNPYRTTPNGVTTYYYDALGRPVETLEADGSSKLQWCYNGVASTPASGSCVGRLGSVASGNWVDSTDENGTHWQRTSDSFGRLTEVVEPNGASQSPTMETDYSYSALNDLLSVKQWGGPVNSSNPRTRAFVYDSLSRLTSSINPETGTIGYSYDANSNLSSKTDARSVRINYSYDVLDRLLSKSYSNDASSTPLACYQYDSSSSSYGIGRLTNEWTQSASQGACSASPSGSGFLTMSSLSYDRMGRLSSEQQSTPASQASGKVYSPAYTYNLAGNLLTSTDGTIPSPTAGTTLTFTNTYDSAEHLVSLTSNWVDTVQPVIHPATLFSAPSNTSTLPCANSIGAPYTAFGALANASYGSGLTLNRSYDARLRQTCETDIGTGNTPATSGTATVTITGVEQTQ